MPCAPARTPRVEVAACVFRPENAEPGFTAIAREVTLSSQFTIPPAHRIVPQQGAIPAVARRCLPAAAALVASAFTRKVTPAIGSSTLVHSVSPRLEPTLDVAPLDLMRGGWPFHRHGEELVRAGSILRESAPPELRRGERHGLTERARRHFDRVPAVLLL